MSRENATIPQLVGPPFPSRPENEAGVHICICPAGPMSVAGLGSEAVAPEPSEPKGNLLELLQ